ncbi:MAG: hypothetical protein A4E53_01724 [Pelotomaculum sp. PtaB.Bin104]|nr:MAG: hypothetical protein A4E53_01724 [Pelotomaculum sp. PtaB.Bin104]
MDWAQIIEAIGKVATESIAIVVLGVGLYLFATSFKKVSESIEKLAEASYRQSEAWVKMSESVNVLTEYVKNLNSMFEKGECPLSKPRNDT